MRGVSAFIALLATAGSAAAARAQDDGPRVYQLAPVGTRTFTAFAVAKRGNEEPEPGSVHPGSKIDTNLLVLRYVQTFHLGGRPFSPFVIVPFGQVKSGGAPTGSGVGDVQVGATLGLPGAPALSASQFVEFDPHFGLQVLARIYFPTGAYSARKPVNLGSNRIAYQLGLPMVLARGGYREPSFTSLEVLPTLTFYQSNDEPFAAARSTKAALASVEAHLTRNLGRRLWISADMLYRRGGETSTDGVADRNGMHGWSAGFSAALPVSRTSLIFTYERVIQRSDGGPDGWFFRTALVAPL